MAHGKEMAHHQTPHVGAPGPLLASRHQQSSTRKHEYKNTAIRRWTLAAFRKLCKRTCTLDGFVISFDIVWKNQPKKAFWDQK